MGHNISFDINNFIGNDPALLVIFFSLSLFGSIIKFMFTDTTADRKNMSTRIIILKMILLSLTSSLILFSSLDLIRRYVKGNLIYLTIFLFGFLSEMFIKQLARLKNISGLLRLIDDLYNFFKSRQ